VSYFLHIETATDVCSVALSKEDKLIVLNEEKDSLKHSEIITLQIKDVMDRGEVQLSDLSAVSLSEGPGSYTSLRVGMSAAKAICFSYDIPLISVNTLESLAYSSSSNIQDDYLICPMIDARRMEVYASLYYKDMNPIFENTPIILNEDSFRNYFEKGYKFFFSGNGANKTKGLFKEEKTIYTNLICSAKNLIIPALEKFKKKKFEAIAYFSPNYIKPPNITTPKVKHL
jgi:tRNA threonylcarbamoyladenosine biosynthesis protein TsaB